MFVLKHIDFEAPDWGELPQPPQTLMSYAAQAAADNPVLWWRLDETAGGVTQDQSTNQLDGAYENVQLNSGGLLAFTADPAVAFDGTTSGIELDNDPLLNTGGPYTQRTVEMVFRADATTARQVLYEQGGTTRGLSIYIRSDRLYLGAWNSAGDDGGLTTPWGSFFLSAPISADVVYHVALILDGDPSGKTGTLRGCLDGDPAAFGSAAGVGRLFSHSDLIGVGRARGNELLYDNGTSSAAERFAGTIDELVIYPQALSDERVAAHAHAALGRMADV